MANTHHLDANQVIQEVFDDAADALRITGSISFTEGATVANGGALPAEVKVVSGYDGTNVRVVHTDAAGDLQVDLASALPAGANAIGTVTVNNAAGASAVNIQDGGNSITVDGSLTVTSSASSTGRTVVTTVRNDYTSVNVTTGAWVQLVASLGATVNEIEIFDSSGQTMELGTGAAAAETRLILIFPGGNGRVPTAIPSGTRISIRAVSANATVGEIDINFYS